MDVTKFTLSTGKAIFFKEPSIDDTEKAAQVAGKKAGRDNEVLLALLMQKEMLGILLVGVQDKDAKEMRELKLSDKASLSTLLTVKEYQQAIKAMNMVTNDEGNGELTPEFISIGKP